METIMPFIVFLGLIAFFFYFNSPLGTALQQASVSQTQEQVSKEKLQDSQTPLKSWSPGKNENETPSLFIDTSITFGPNEGKIIEETNEVVFEFKGSIFQEKIKEKIYFETKIEGLDSNWVKTYQQKRIVRFPSLAKEYVFSVRARTESFVDPTPAKRTFRINISPYFKKISINSVRIKTQYNLSLITLQANLSSGERINITDWYLEGKKAKVTIPKAVKNYYHYYNSPQAENILVSQGERIYLSAGFNPLGRDKNFQLNKCIGYLNNSFDFPIPVSNSCPRPTKREISHLDPCCQEFIRHLRTCETPDYSEKPKIYGDQECVSYLNENFNNRGCFQKYSEDKYFLENVWHLYLNGKDITLLNDCDTIYLRDQNGLLIDKYSYGTPVCW